MNSNIYRPTAVIVDVSLNVYVADMATNCIIALTSNGTLIRTCTNSLYNPQGLISGKVLQIYSSHDPVLIAPHV